VHHLAATGLLHQAFGDGGVLKELTPQAHMLTCLGTSREAFSLEESLKQITVPVP